MHHELAHNNKAAIFGLASSNQSDEISLALFEGDWLSTDAAFKRSMLITMTRVQKPITLTIGGFSPLTLATFVTVNYIKH